VPLIPGDPLHPPEALQDVAYAEVQVRVTDSPASTVVAEASIDTVGSGGAAGPPPQAHKHSGAPMSQSRKTIRMTPQFDFFQWYVIDRAGNRAAIRNRAAVFSQLT
jgi:hypothetical protein